ncbi:hypothetical protein HRTV-28_gp12 [Halorubrum tailed virus 28]|uniref:Uncharacterized protein n=1 Tax=Halorubrum tailed virus 28 TaxID=2878009 RepID=A0AAE8Y091_9CAUD|nr:hypothetical protein M1M39_gp13 [Halorubrum tailed virus 28]UBF23450.1 hypothetical protein HRTV-28_gp12 [Halorubrum tailed virus 28]
MVTLQDTRDRRHPRTMAVATRETVRTNADGTVSVDAEEHVETLKRAGFEEADDSDDADDLEDLTIGELRDKAEDAGIAEETDLRSKDSIVEALRDAGAE